jgi:hypothetical protein
MADLILADLAIVNKLNSQKLTIEMGEANAEILKSAYDAKPCDDIIPDDANTALRRQSPVYSRSMIEGFEKDYSKHTGDRPR